MNYTTFYSWVNKINPRSHLKIHPLIIDNNSIHFKTGHVPKKVKLGDYNITNNGLTIIKNIYIHRNSHLPPDGWLHPCFQCNLITSNTILFLENAVATNIRKFHIHICKLCAKTLTQKHKVRWHKYIIHNYKRFIGHTKIYW
jgi:hypothetical protein